MTWSRAALLINASGPDWVERESGTLPVRATCATKMRTNSGSDVPSSWVTFVARLSSFGSTRHRKSTVMLQKCHKAMEAQACSGGTAPWPLLILYFWARMAESGGPESMHTAEDKVTVATTDQPWAPDSWQKKPAAQQPVYPDPRRAAPRAGPAGPAAAAGHQLGDREPQAAIGGGHPRRTLPAARRRLLGKLRRLRIRRHRQQAQDPAADEPGAGAGRQEACHPHRPLRRPVRQAALDRHRDAQRRHAAQLPRRHDQPRRVHRAKTARPIPSCCSALTSGPA